MHNTKDKTGIMIFILFDEKKFEIIADEGINSKISESKWNDLTSHLVLYFRNSQYKEGIIYSIKEIGIIYSIKEIGKILISEFPVSDDDINELSDEVIIK